MVEDTKLLELEFCKVRNQLQTLKGNVYSNLLMDSYQDKIFQLFYALEKQIASKPNISEKEVITNAFGIISQSVQFLEDSILNLIPFETAFCLEKVLYEWKCDDCILVTTFKRNRYAFDPFLSINNTVNFEVIKHTYGIDFEKRLLQISIPNHEVNDYFFSMVLYHELAHYIDLKYKITESLIKEEYSTLSADEKRIKENHLREHFADVFAAQYISDTFIYFLELRAYEDGEGETHPATSERIELIEKFIDGDTDTILNQLQKATLDSTGNELIIRYEEVVQQDDFFNYLPPIIENDKQLHGLFVNGWDIWMNEKARFAEEDSFKIYTYLNNLIEKSISNYMIQSQWDGAIKSKTE